MIFQSFKKGFDDVVEKYVLSKNTPIKPNKKKAKGRVEKVDSQGTNKFHICVSRKTCLRLNF